MLVVERQRDADEDRRDEEASGSSRSRSSFSASRPSALAQNRRRPRLRGGVAGSVKLKMPSSERRRGRHRERVAQRACRDRGLRVPGEHEADHEPGDDPADRTPHADVAETGATDRPSAGTRSRSRAPASACTRSCTASTIRIEAAELRRACEQIHQHGADRGGAHASSARRSRICRR